MVKSSKKVDSIEAGKLSDFLLLRVPDNSKDLEWYKFHSDRLVPSYSMSATEDYEVMKKIYEFINNDLGSFEYEVNKYCGAIDFESEEELIPYNPIPNKLDSLKGDILARGNNMKVVLLTPKAIKSKNDELKAKIQESVEQELSVAIEKQKAMMEGMSEEEAAQHVEQLRSEYTPADISRKNFQSESEILFNKLLQYSLITQDVTSKKLDTAVDFWATSRFFTYPGWRHGRPYIKICNPLHIGFDKNPDERFIQKGDYVWYRDEITIADALQEYQNKLTKDEIDSILSYGRTTNGITKDHMERPLFDYTKYYSVVDAYGDRMYKNVGMNQGTSLTNINFHSSIWRVHLEFKAYSELLYVTTTDAYNDRISYFLKKSTHIIPSDANKATYTNKWGFENDKYTWADEFGNEFEAELVWVPRRYEVTRLGEDVYVDYREVPFQPDNTDNPFEKFELTYKGAIFNNRNATFVSRVQRALPYAFQYMGVKRLQDREIAKYVGQEAVIDVDQIPDELGYDADGNALSNEDRVLAADVMARKTGKRHVSPTRFSNGLPPPPTRTLGVQYNVVDTSPQLNNLQSFCMLLNSELGMIMGVPPSREGQPLANTNVTDNRQALMQSTLSTQADFFYIDRVWLDTLNEQLYNQKTYIKQIFEQNPTLDNHELEFILPDGSRELLSITPDQLERLEDIGLFLLDAGKDKLYFDYMTSPQVIQAFAQNAGEGIEATSAVLKAMTTATSVEETHKIIVAEADRQRKRAEQMAQQQQQAQEQASQYAMQLEKYKSDLKLNEGLALIEAQKELKLEQSRLDSEKFAKQFDIDQNKVNDQIENADRQRRHDTVENEKDRNVEREKIKSQEKVAVLSKRNSTSK